MELARTKILRILALADRPLAVHEINADSVSATSASARLRELHREGLVIKAKAPGKRFDLWSRAPLSDYSCDQPQAGRRLLKELDKQMIQDVAECEELGIPYWVKGE